MSKFVFYTNAMSYFFEIQETPESKPLIEHLLTLKYVKKRGRKVWSETDMIKAVKRAERSKSISLEDSINRSGKWKNRLTK